MKKVKTSFGRRSFIKSMGLAGGGLMLGFSWLASCTDATSKQVLAMPDEWFDINGFLKIGENGLITIMSPNPEIGQNVKTSMPMIVADELDADWNKVIVEQAPLNTDIFTRQLAGGSASIRQGWEGLRIAGATARNMLREAAAQAWQVPFAEITTDSGMLYHKASGKSAHYGEMASTASTLDIPEEVELKENADFSIIGTSRKNVDGKKIVTGKPLFGLDIYEDNMLIAMVIRPPAFGMQFKSMDEAPIKRMAGIKDVFSIETYSDDTVRQWTDREAFSRLVVIVGDTTWQVMRAKKELRVEWEESPNVTQVFGEGDNAWSNSYPSGLEGSRSHAEKLAEADRKPAEELRRDGNPEQAFDEATKVLERSYSCPFLAHNTLEPMNFYADVTDEQALVIGPVQSPEYAERTLSSRLGLPPEKVEVQMTRMGGGFGRRLYTHYVIEAAVISKHMGSPIKLVYTREDDMTSGIYRPIHFVTYKAGLNEENELIAFHVKAGGIPTPAIFPDRFPAGCVENYLAESWSIDTNISTGLWRAPRSNFIAGAEQSFLDELAELMGKDPIDFRLELLDKAMNSPIGENNDYDPERYAGVLRLVKEKSNWSRNVSGSSRGVAAYFSHRSYVAQIVDLIIENGKPKIEKVTSAVDCGIVINPDAAINMVEGAVIDGIGHAMYSEMTFKDGVPQSNNFDNYRLIRHGEAPKNQEVYFVQNDIDPTGLGEPPLPPVIGALANALYKATGKRYYHQPFDSNNQLIG